MEIETIRKCTITEYIDIEYQTGGFATKFKLRFGGGISSKIEPDADVRTNFETPYKIEVFENGEGETYKKGYRIIGNKGPIVVDISDIKIECIDSDRMIDCSLGVVFDINEPKYAQDKDMSPNNGIERDGCMWEIPFDKFGKSNKFDQNGDATRQLVITKALQQGYKPTDDELLMGYEETTKTTGVLYITFMLLYKEFIRTRGISSTPARIGYGNLANTPSIRSSAKHIPNTQKYILPVRYMISDDDKTPDDVQCSNTLAGAKYLDSLQKQTVIF